MANHFVVPDLCHLTAKWAKLLTKMGEIADQNGRNCKVNWAKLVCNMG